MKLILLGTGTPILETDRQGSAFLVQGAGEVLLFDTGRGVNTQLLRAGLSPEHVDSIFITHHHADHMGGLGDVLISAWHLGRKKPVRIYGPPGTLEIVDALLNVVYKRDIDFALATEDKAHPRVLFEVHELSSGSVVQGTSWHVKTETVKHGHRLKQSEFPCLGYRLETPRKVLALTGDSVASDSWYALAQDADVLIQSCHLAHAELTTPDLRTLAEHVIADSSRVGKMAARAKVKTLVLTHFRKKSRALMRSLQDDVQKDFPGELILGEDLLELSI